MEKLLSKLCDVCNLGSFVSLSKLSGGLMHKMFKVKTNNGVYAIKLLNPEVMAREEAYNNFIVSEKISNLALENGIPVSSALKINDTFIFDIENNYFMIFNFVEGKTLKDDEISIEHCEKIGELLSNIHSLDYSCLGLSSEIVEYKRLYDWESYINNSNFDNMSYKELFLRNYKKFNSMLKRANERFNVSNKVFTICHRDMDPKNVMWNGDKPIVIDWESASISNPYRELLEDALCWSGFLTDNFDKDKFIAFFNEYKKYKDISNVDWFDVICGNLVGRFGWLKYNLERSLGILSNDDEEIKIAENEVSKTIDEINRYLELIGDMYNIINSLVSVDGKSYDSVIEKIVNDNGLLKGSSYDLINSGFTNTIYEVGNYIVRICTDYNNEDRFKNEIDFYNLNKNNENVPNIYFSDLSKSLVPYYYEIMEKVNGKTLYEIWYKISNNEREDIVKKIIYILKSFHSVQVESYDFCSYIKSIIINLLKECNLDVSEYKPLLDKCDKYFEVNKFGLIHGDLHFDNFIYDGENIKLLDFERYMVAPIDYDFMRLSRYSKTPWHWASVKTDMLAVETDYVDLMDMFISNYEELRDIPYLEERLKIYTIIDMLKGYRHSCDKMELEETNKVIGGI